jgi:hypothetical protein
MGDSRPELINAYTVWLLGIQPPIWRRIELAGSCSFWDLHVAIQDSMGWLDYHLHEFELYDPRRKQNVRVGLPDEDDGLETPLFPGWKVPVKRYFKRPGDRAGYLYDFGDGWTHDVQLTGIALPEPGVAYPRCTDGARACPPEDCGGVGGYEELVEVVADPRHPERRSIIAWLKGHAKNYHPYRPEYFDPRKVVFTDPGERLRRMVE